jgi:hypothetical protein
MKLRILLILIIPVILAGCIPLIQGESGKVNTSTITDRWSSKPRIELVVEKEIVDNKSAEYWQSIADNYQRPEENNIRESGKVNTSTITDRWSSKPRIELVVEKEIVENGILDTFSDAWDNLNTQAGQNSWDTKLYRLGEVLSNMGTPYSQRGVSPSYRWMADEPNSGFSYSDYNRMSEQNKTDRKIKELEKQVKDSTFGYMSGNQMYSKSNKYMGYIKNSNLYNKHNQKTGYIRGNGIYSNSGKYLGYTR